MTSQASSAGSHETGSRAREPRQQWVRIGLELVEAAAAPTGNEAWRLLRVASVTGRSLAGRLLVRSAAAWRGVGPAGTVLVMPTPAELESVARGAPAAPLDDEDRAASGPAARSCEAALAEGRRSTA